jgi:hypothetical protein
VVLQKCVAACSNIIDIDMMFELVLIDMTVKVDGGGKIWGVRTIWRGEHAAEV